MADESKAERQQDGAGLDDDELSDEALDRMAESFGCTHCTASCIHGDRQD
jgi:heterodisulfide reductase subunit C